MSESKELVSNDRLVRELSIKIRELTRDFDKKFGKASRNSKDKTVRRTRMSIYTDDRENDRFYHKLQSFGIDKDNDEQLREMDKNLARLKKSLERRLRDLRFAREDYEIEDIAAEIQRTFQASPIMQRLNPDILKERIENLKYSPEMSKSDYINLIRAEIKQINFERDSARTVIIANGDPELKKTFDELMRCSALINEEAEYRDNQREVTTRYNELCRGYQTLEKIEQELSEANIPEKRRKQLIELKEKTLKDLRKSMSDKREITEEGRLAVSKEKFTKSLKGEIEALAFQKNALNGIVDPDVVRRDKFTIAKSDCFAIFDNFESLTALENARRKRPILNDNPDFSEYTKRVELKMLMHELTITYQQKVELDKIKARLAELNAKKDLTPAELEERSKLSKQQVDIHRRINSISKNMDRIRTLGKELGIPCVIDGSLDLNSVEQLNSVGISQVEKSMKKQKEQARAERKKVCEKYGVDDTLSDSEVSTAINDRIKEIISKKRQRIIDLEYDETKDVSAPRNTSTINNSSVVPLEFEGSAPKNIPKTSVENRDNGVEDKEDSYGDRKVVQTMQVYDIQSQLDTNDPQYKQRVEFGRVYRYERGKKDGELHFVEEDLEVYLENPKKKLNEILDGLREKVLAEFPSEKELENYCDKLESKEFKGLLSKSPIKRARAKKELIKKLEEVNGDRAAFGYINMAIALNSELLPDAIGETLGRYAQPYGKRESDMAKYVKIKGRSTILGRSEKGEIVSSRLSNVHVESIHQEEKFTSTIDLHSRNDGLVRPFEIEDAEMGRGMGIVNQPVSKEAPKRTRNRRRKNKDKSQDGEIE